MAANTPADRTSIKTDESLTVDICVIGAGPAGLALATGAAAFGQRVALIEKHKTGGSNLYFGAVPSKALIAASRQAEAIRRAGAFGLKAGVITVDHGAVRDHIRSAVAAIALDQSRERLAGLGITVISAAARFANRDTVVAGEYRITARRFVIATGSSPNVPVIAGLDAVPYLTTETIFENAQPVPHLCVIGADPAGLEIAQAYLRLGSKVTVLSPDRILAGYDAEFSAPLATLLEQEGLDIKEHLQIRQVSGQGNALTISGDAGGMPLTVSATHILIATGRAATVNGLGLDAAGVKTGQQGIIVDRRLVTSNRRVYAIGDVASADRSASIAIEQARIALGHILFRAPATFKPHTVPSVVYTSPEIAHVGLTEDAARLAHGRIKAVRWPCRLIDRARTDLDTAGHIKIVTTSKGGILGVTILAPNAGDLIDVWTLAVKQGLSIKAFATAASPYPTLSEINKRAGQSFYGTVALSPIVRKIIALLAKLG